MSEKHWWWSALCSTLVIVAVGIVCFRNSTSGVFVVDDHKTIEENEQIRQLWPPIWFTDGTKDLSNSGRPLIGLSLAIDYAIGGLNVRAWHVTNIAIHILCAIVLASIIRQSLRFDLPKGYSVPSPGGIALCCALLWLVHPLQTECVNYIIARTESIMGLFYLLTFYCAIRARRCSRISLWGIVAVLFCIAGMASKEAMVTAPFLIGLYDYAFRQETYRATIRRRWPLYLGLASTWTVLALLMWQGPRSESVGGELGVSAWQYAENQAVILIKYLGLCFWPRPLVVDYGPPKTIPLSIVFASGGVLVILFAAIILALIYRSRLGFLGAWFFVILSPSSSVIPIVTEVGADRRVYLSLAAVVILVVIGFLALGDFIAQRRRDVDRFQTLPRPPGLRIVPLFSWTVIMVVVMGVTSAARSADFHSRIALWRKVAEGRPQNARAHYNVAVELQAENKLAEAVPFYEEAVRRDPDYAPGHLNLAITLKALNRLDEAAVHYREVLRIAPTNVNARIDLGNALKKLGRLNEAIDQYHLALRISPDHPIAYLNLGNALLITGDAAGGLQALQQAMRLNPRWPAPVNRIAWILATHPDDRVRNPEQAIQFAQRAVQMTGRKNPIMLDTLAAAYASAGHFDAAVQTLTEGLALATGSFSHLAEAMQERMRRYQQRKPYREPVS